MKTKLLLMLLSFVLLSSTCSPDEIEQSCNCKKVYYDYTIIGMYNGVSPIWGYKKVSEEIIECTDETSYVQIDANSYYRIECE